MTTHTSPQETMPGKAGVSDKQKESWAHPCILLRAEERPAVLRRIKEYPPAAEAKALLQEQVDADVKVYAATPDAILKKIPAFGDGFYQHSPLLSKMTDAAILHFVTGEAAYGRYAGDLLNVYLSHLAERAPDTASICGDRTRDVRGLFPKIGLSYDFLHPYLTTSGTMVYDPKTKTRVPFDNAAAQKALVNLVHYGFDLSGPPARKGRVSNHAILHIPGILWPLLCVENRQERERFFDVFWDKGTKFQPSLKNCVLPMLNGQGIWPESASYGGANPMSAFDVIDRCKPELEIIENNEHILRGASLRVQLSDPHGKYVRFGDSKRTGGLGSVPLVFYLAHKKGMKDVARDAEVLIKGYNKGNTGDAWTPGVGPTHNNFGYRPPLALFLDPIPYDPAISGKRAYRRTLSILRTSPRTGYYLDIFRSRANKENKFHDYLYHNIGDDAVLTNAAGKAFELAPTDKYDNDIGDLVKSPGWRFFEDEQSTQAVDDGVRVTFKVDVDKRYMHMFVPGGVSREYTKALGPPTLEAQNGYDKKKTQILAIRQNGEAWDRPVVAVFEPSTKEKPSHCHPTGCWNGGILEPWNVGLSTD